MEVIILLAVLGGVVAVIARSKGFDAVGWWLYGAALFPIALAHVIVKPSAAVVNALQTDISESRACPECAESIKADAKVCRYCGNRDFPVPETLSDDDAWFASLGTYKPVPKPTMWQKLWWNPHGPDRGR